MKDIKYSSNYLTNSYTYVIIYVGDENASNNILKEGLRLLSA
jgi:hypothetical protein